MFKKMLVSTLLAGFSASSLAAGFYAGIGAGPAFVDFNKNSTVVNQDTNVNDNSRLSATGMYGSLFGGYAWVRHAFHLAAEANVDVSNAKAQTHNDDLIHQNLNSSYYRFRKAFGLSLLPGYLYTNSTLFFARIGYSYGSFSVASTETTQPSINRNLNGISFGLGVGQSFTQHIAARMEYKQTNYQDTSETAVDGATTKTTNLSPTTGQVEFSLIYDF